MKNELLEITKTETLKFINQFNERYNNKLKNFFYYPEVVRLSWFYKWLNKNKKDFYFSNICVAGGNKTERELQFLKFDNIFELDIAFNDNFDLNLDIDIDQKFDLVLCNQVMEHLHDPFKLIENLKKITKENGYIFISVPQFNNVHGESYRFYTSGYHIDFLFKCAEKNDLEVINYGEFGSAKNLMHTMAGDWLTYNKLRRGIRTRKDIFFPILTLTDGLDQHCKISNFLFKREFITDYWIMLKR